MAIFGAGHFTLCAKEAPIKAMEYHGISAGLTQIAATDWLKREILLYDKVGLVHLDASIWILRTLTDGVLHADTYEYLKDAGVIYEPQIPTKSKVTDVLSSLKRASEARERFYDALPLWAEGRGADEALSHDIDEHALIARAIAIEETQSLDVISTPILKPVNLFQEERFHKTANVIQAVIHEFPVPEETVPFEDLIMLRKESEFVEKRNALRSWVRSVAANEWSQNEIREEIRYRLHQYEEYMRVQKVKYRVSSLSAVASYTAGLAEDLLKVKLQSITEKICSIFCENVSLTEAELSAPGRELAYISALNARLRA